MTEEEEKRQCRQEAGKTFCKNAFSRAHLTSIEDDEHGTFLTTLARSKDTNVGPFWTGASDSKGHTFWLLGSKKCKSLGFMGLGLLGDNNCNTRLPFVCMYKPKIYP